MRNELQAIKGALGPWSPDADSSPSTPYTQATLLPQPPPNTTTTAHLPFSPPTSATVPPYPWRGHHDAPADVMTHAAPPAPSLADDPAADLAAYFPPPTNDTPPSPTTSTGTATGPANRSLSATLTALRSALQTHDARARMSASAHAAELGAIRQVVAGLRMQLHAVLMELSSSAGNAGADGWIPPKLPAAVRFFMPGLVPPSPLPAVSITKL
jgi:hypothetical protein